MKDWTSLFAEHVKGTEPIGDAPKPIPLKRDTLHLGRDVLWSIGNYVSEGLPATQSTSLEGLEGRLAVSPPEHEKRLKTEPT